VSVVDLLDYDLSFDVSNLHLHPMQTKVSPSHVLEA
jgi:hypothetical protein